MLLLPVQQGIGRLTLCGLSLRRDKIYPIVTLT